ncbi:MAG: glutamate-1-semialdehyde 2,1-aminomutase [Actinomycetota bacterium]|nr:glutamate-1-semialdehyde 2,1-aminomutase [Actinomycetota bacterium]
MRPAPPSPLQSALRERLQRAIPGGAHTNAKADDQYPAMAPAAIVRGEGCRVWDIDGNVYVEYGSGLRSVTLGHAFPSVVRAAAAALEHGVNFLRPSPLEAECAEQLLALIEGADMVKFTKDGSTATTGALKLARAHTGRDLVALCDSHFFSYDDWYMTITEASAGIPRAIAELTLTFAYNDLASLERLFAEHPSQIACVYLEPERTVPPADGFLQDVAQLCAREGALLVFDELITGFRWHAGGAQAVYGVTPDLSTFGKGMANGFSVSALLGRRELMRLGGFDHDQERVFLLSTTHGAETHGLAAASATMSTYAEHDVVGALHEAGRQLREGVESAARAAGVQDVFRVLGRDCNLVFETRDPDGAPSQAFRTLFMQELVTRGVLAPSFVVNYSHDEDTIGLTIEIVAEALTVYRDALENGVERYLRGPAVKPPYRRFN